MALKGKRGPRPGDRKPKTSTKPNGHDATRAGQELRCKGKDCTFQTPDMGEMMEHLSGTGHTDYDTVQVQPEQQKPGELFSGPETIKRKLEVPISDEERAAINSTAATLAIKRLEQIEISENAKAAAKGLEAELNKELAKLRKPTKPEDVECRWEIRMDENAKVLIRLDTNAEVERRALSAEDRAREEKRAAEVNKQQAQAPAADKQQGAPL